MAQGGDRQGKWRIVEFPADERPISRFMSERLQEEQLKVVAAYLRKCKQHPKGPFWNSYKFKKLSGSENIWERKPGGQVRLLGFFDPDERRVFVLTNGFVKKQDRTPRREIERAEKAHRRLIRAREGRGK